MKTMEEIEREYIEEQQRKEEQAAAEEAKKEAEYERFSGMDMGEYIAARSGTPAPMKNEDLESLDMKEYIKARKNGR